MSELTKEYIKDLSKARRCAASGEAHHWPTIADILAIEVSRLEQQNEALLAQVEEYRFMIAEYIDDTAMGAVLSGTLNKYPEQSLDSLKSRIEEETISRCINTIGEKIDYMNGLYDACETLEGKEYLRGRIEQIRDDIELLEK